MGSAQVRGCLWGAAAADWAQFTELAMTPVYEAVRSVFTECRQADGSYRHENAFRYVISTP